MTTLTYEQGIIIQRQQLQEWVPKLSAALFLDLSRECALRNIDNPLTATGYDVWRGNDMNNFINNWTPNKSGRYAI